MSGRPRPQARPIGFWNDHRNVEEGLRELEREYAEVAESLGHSPVIRELRALGKTRLGREIIKYYPGSFYGIRQVMGLEHVLHPDNYWTPERIEEEYLSHAKDGMVLRRHDLPKTLASAITRCYPGGMTGLRKKIGEKLPKRDNMRDLKAIEKMYLSLSKRVGHSPTAKDLEQLDKGLMRAVRRFYPGGIRGLRDALGIPQIRRPMNCWRKWSDIEAALREWIAIHDLPLTQKRLSETGYSSMCQAISLVHGGLASVCRRLGITEVEQPLRDASAYWKSWNNAEPYIRAVIDEVGHFPSVKEITSLRRLAVLRAIRAHGGLVAVRARMGYGPVTVAVLKEHAEPLVRIVLALKERHERLDSDVLWSAIKKQWSVKELSDALEAFETNGDLSAFLLLLNIT